VVTARVGEPSADVVARATAAGQEWVVVLAEDGTPRSWPAVEEIKTRPHIVDYLDRRLPTVAESSTLNDALDSMLATSQGGTLIVDTRRQVIGELTMDSVIDVIRGQLDDARTDQRSSYSDHTEGSSSSATAVGGADEPNVPANS
jgi:osmoprotectant transport system ATP-binding protein